MSATQNEWTPEREYTMYLEGFSALMDQLGGYPMGPGHEMEKRGVLHHQIKNALAVMYNQLDKAQAGSEGWGPEDEEYLIGAIQGLKDLLNQFPLENPFDKK